MNGFEHPGTILLIHQAKVRAELERDRQEHLRDERLPRPRGGGPSRLRMAIGRGLVSLGRRIAPVDAGVPVGAPR